MVAWPQWSQWSGRAGGNKYLALADFIAVLVYVVRLSGMLLGAVRELGSRKGGMSHQTYIRVPALAGSGHRSYLPKYANIFKMGV